MKKTMLILFSFTRQSQRENCSSKICILTGSEETPLCYQQTRHTFNQIICLHLFIFIMSVILPHSIALVNIHRWHYVQQ